MRKAIPEGAGFEGDIQALQHPAEQLEAAGLQAFAAWRYQEALDCFSRARPLFEAENNWLRAADQWYHLGDLYLSAQLMEKAAEHYYKAQELYQQQNHLPGLSKTLINLGRLFLYQEPEKSLNMATHGLIQAEKWAVEPELIAHALMNIGWMHAELGDEYESLDFYKQALELAEQTPDSYKRIDMLLRIATAYRNLGDTTSALKLLETARYTADNSGDRDSQAYVLSHLGAFYDGIEDFQKALEYYECALTLYESKGAAFGEVTMLEAIGFLYAHQTQHDKALAYYQRALEVSHSLNNPYLESELHINLANAYVQSEQPQNAIPAYLAAIKRKQDLAEFPGLARGLLELGTLLSQLASYEKAHYYLAQSLELAQQYEMTDLLPHIQMAVGENAIKTQQTEQAVDAFQQVLEWVMPEEDPVLTRTCYQHLALLLPEVEPQANPIDWWEAALQLTQAETEPQQWLFIAMSLMQEYQRQGKAENAQVLQQQMNDCLQASPQQFSLEERLVFLRQAGDTWFYQPLRQPAHLRQARLYYTEALDVAHQARNALAQSDLYRLIGLSSALLQEVSQFEQAFANALELAQSIEQRLLLWEEQVYQYLELGLLGAGIQRAQHLLSQALAAKATATIFKAINALSHTYHMIHQPQALAAYYQQVGQHFKQQQQWPEAVQILGDFGHLLSELKEHKRALSCLEEILHFPADMVPQHAQIFLDLGILYAENKEDLKAFHCFKKSLMIARQQRQIQDQIAALIYLGVWQRKQSQADKARILIEEGLQLAINSGDQYYEAWALCRIAAFDIELQDWHLAQPRLEKSLAIFKRLQESQGQAECLLLLGKVYAQQALL